MNVISRANSRSLSVSPSISARRRGEHRAVTAARFSTVPLCAITQRPRRNGWVLASEVPPTVFFRTWAMARLDRASAALLR
jgi:hypothetical protein